jgi:phage shock protein PspC (stress-responsive transcriptional regulator)
MNNNLLRSNDRIVLGVCSGIANCSGIDVYIVRILTIICCIFSGGSIIALYFLVGFLKILMDILDILMDR